MDTSIRIACGMMREQEAAARGDQSGARTIGAPRARSGDGKYPDHNTRLYGLFIDSNFSWVYI